MIERPKPGTIVIVNQHDPEITRIGMVVNHIGRNSLRSQIEQKWTFVLLDDGISFFDVYLKDLTLL